MMNRGDQSLPFLIPEGAIGLGKRLYCSPRNGCMRNDFHSIEDEGASGSREAIIPRRDR